MNKRVLITICGRAGSKGFRNKNLKIFCGRPISHYSVAAALLFARRHVGIDADIVLNTDSPELREVVAAAYPEVACIERPEALCGDSVPKMDVFRHSLQVMEEQTGRPYDYHMDLDITSPMRTVADVENCFAVMEGREDLDVVMSAAKSRRSPYMNMAKREGDHVEQVVKTHFVARQQTPVCYDINASVYTFKRRFLAENTSGFLWDGKCEISEMPDLGVLDIDSEEDFILMELLAGHFFSTDAAYREVRDAIRVAEK